MAITILESDFNSNYDTHLDIIKLISDVNPECRENILSIKKEIDFLNQKGFELKFSLKFDSVNFKK